MNENCEAGAYEKCTAHSRTQQASPRCRGLVHVCLDLGDLLLSAFCAACPFKHVKGLLEFSFHGQEARRFGCEQDEHKEHCRWRNSGGKHPSPVVCASVAEKIVEAKRYDDANHNRHLVESSHTAADGGRRDLS